MIILNVIFPIFTLLFLGSLLKHFGITNETFLQTADKREFFFTLPTSTAIYVLSDQLNSDTQLASAAILLSTLLSFISLSVILVI